MGFFSRLGNLWKGFWSGVIGGAETSNPEAVYEAAIEERISRHAELKKAVSGIVYLRNKTQTELDDKQKELGEIQTQIPVAVEEGEDEAALVLIQKKDELTVQIAELQVTLEKNAAEAEDSKRSLIAFAGEIEALKREKDQMLARKANAEARIQIQETLDGLSTEADIRALENVRENIEKLQAEAEIGDEIDGASLDEKLANIREKAADSNAQSQLDELKKQMAARKAAQTEGPKNL
ncbi:MAG: PspA/IM30 family protein [Myxococcota bacterium]|nr:PspA/IM30 family protein [Myxococcota bacterium]